MATSEVYSTSGVLVSRRPGFWAQRIEPSKRSNNNNNSNQGRGRLSGGGTDGQLDTAETQPCPWMYVPSRIALASAYQAHASLRVGEAPAGRQGENRRGACKQKTPQIS